MRKKYPKIQTLWKRDEKGKIIENDYSKKEFKLINNWVVQEKIDGQNWRIYVGYDEEEIEGNKIVYEGLIMQGRTKKSEFNSGVIDRLKENIDPNKIKEQIDGKAILYGELVGDKIQKGSWKYTRKEDKEPENEFILFDAHIGRWWLETKDIPQLAKDLGLKHAPIIGTMTEEEIVNYVCDYPKSLIAKEEKKMEGIVAKSEPLLLFRDEKPLVFKLKLSDYERIN